MSIDVNDKKVIIDFGGNSSVEQCVKLNWHVLGRKWKVSKWG